MLNTQQQEEPGVPQERLNEIAQGGEQENRYDAYREYYDGDHDTQLTKRQRKYLQLKTGQEFNANYCPVVVDALAEKLNITGFLTKKAKDAKKLWEWWQANRMDAIQGITHTAAVRDGDAYVMVGWHNDLKRPQITFEPAFDGNEGVKVHYGNTKRGVPLFASKIWKDGGAQRLNLYYSNRIEKYIKTEHQAGWSKYIEQTPDEEPIWPLDWTKMDGFGLGIPVIHFKNRDQGYNYGGSELVNIIPPQNALNKALIDLVAAADTTAFRIYWMLGDDPSELEVTPGSWVYSTKPPKGAGTEEGVEIGYFPGEDLSKLLEFKDGFVMEIARISRTPMHYFQISRQRPAEGTLKQEEAGLISRAQRLHVTFGNAWEDVLGLAMRLHETYGGEPGIDPEIIVSTVWKDPVTRDDKTHLETLDIKRKLGVPQETLWSEMGYSADKIAAMKATEEYQGRQEMQRLALGIGEEDEEEEEEE